MTIRLDFFGEPFEAPKHDDDPVTVLAQKFRDFPFAYFDGVPDPAPYDILPQDYALTAGMNNRITGATMKQFLDNVSASREAVGRCLRAIPMDLTLWSPWSARHDQALKATGELFRQLVQAKGTWLASAAKTLCRKRPAFIPMLDRIVEDGLWDVAKAWRRDKAWGPAALPPPKWFRDLYDDWEVNADPRVYMRMMGDDVARQEAVLHKITVDARTAEPLVGSPTLLRAYESLLWWHEYEEST